MRIFKYAFLMALFVYGIGSIFSLLGFRELGFKILMVGGVSAGSVAALFLMCASVLGRTHWDDFDN